MSRPGTAPRPRRRPDDEGVAMLQVVLVLLVTAAMSVAVLGTVTAEIVPTAHERTRSRTVAAADAGLQAGLALVRAARSEVPGAGVLGDPSELPCATADEPLRGTAGAEVDDDTTSGTDYAVVIRYYDEDPAGRDAAWRAENALACTPGAGVARAPQYALLASVASARTDGRLPADWADRALEAVYAFSTTDAGLAGGVVRVGGYSVSADLCWSAGSSSPSAGAAVTLAECDESSDAQRWALRDDYSVVLASTQSSVVGAYDGMCLTAQPRDRWDRSDATGGGDDAVATSSTAVLPEPDGPVEGSATALTDGGWLRTTTSVAAPSSVTVSAWIRTTAAGGTVVGFGGDDGTAALSPDRLLWMDDAGRLVWGVSPTLRRTVTSAGRYDDGRWHHVAASHGLLGLRLYVDGALVASDTTWVTAGTTAGWWHLGWGGQTADGWLQAPTDPFWNGALAHVTVWDRQLTDPDVTTVAGTPDWDTTRTTTLDYAPAAYWPLGGAHDDQQVYLDTCSGGNDQKWAYNDGARLEQVRPDGASLSGRCVGASAVAAGARLVMAVPCGSAIDWAPSAPAGAGAAGETTGQLVNYGEYGRCLDVTFQNVTWPYLIAFPCKADPTRPVLWNQRFRYDTATRQIVTPAPSGNHCLVAPAVDGGYVLTQPCTAGSARQEWRVLGASGSRATAYTVVDTDGRCLSLGTPGASSGGLAQWSTIVAEACDGSTSQKWNAPPQVTGAGVDDRRETTLDG